MKFRVKDLFNRPVQLEVTGQEEWLKDLYASFAVATDKPPGVLSASFAITKDVAGFVQVVGKVNYTPFLDCSRCSETIAWPINQEVEVVFRPAAPDTSGGREINLTKDELDQYVIVDGAIDIEGLLNDVIQMAIPISTVRLNEDESACMICGLNVDLDLVYGNDEPVKESPFAALKDVKTKK